MPTRASFVVIVILILGTAQAGDDALVKKELQALRGNWNVPINGEPGTLEQFSMVEDSLQIRIGGSISIDCQFTVNPAKKPKEITITRRRPDGSDISMLGIYELEGDTFKVCLNDFGKDRPTDFKAKALVLTREKKKDK